MIEYIKKHVQFLSVMGEEQKEEKSEVVAMSSFADKAFLTQI